MMVDFCRTTVIVEYSRLPLKLLALHLIANGHLAYNVRMLSRCLQTQFYGQQRIVGQTHKAK